MKNKKLIYDISLISALLAVALVLLFLNSHRSAGAEVAVRVDGVEIGRYSLFKDATYELNGGTNILRIENGCAFLVSADCPDHLCIKQGKIKNTGECITCLPNKLTVTVYGAEDGVDIVVG